MECPLGTGFLLFFFIGCIFFVWFPVDTGFFFFFLLRCVLLVLFL